MVYISLFWYYTMKHISQLLTEIWLLCKNVCRAGLLCGKSIRFRTYVMYLTVTVCTQCNTQCITWVLHSKLCMRNTKSQFTIVEFSQSNQSHSSRTLSHRPGSLHTNSVLLVLVGLVPALPCGVEACLFMPMFHCRNSWLASQLRSMAY